MQYKAYVKRCSLDYKHKPRLSTTSLVANALSMASTQKQLLAKAPNPGSKNQAENLTQTRREHATEVAEDYVEAIADLVSEIGEARLVDLAKRLGVTHVTVNRAIARLQRSGLVTSQPYRAIFLTDKGLNLASKCKTRHETVVAFLRSLGI